MTHMTPCPLSRHTTKRGQQRGIPVAVIQAVVAFHDLEREAGGGCRVLRISRWSATNDQLTGLSRQLLDLLPQVAVLWSDDNARVVTVLRDARRGRGRRYRIRK